MGELHDHCTILRLISRSIDMSVLRGRFLACFAGGLHPRAKQTIGRRLALGAAAVAYNQSVPFTGPKLKNCSVLPEGAHCFAGEAECDVADNAHGFSQRQITINFDEELLGSDAVLVWPTSPDTEGLTMIAMYNCLNGTCIASCEGNATCVESCAVLNTPVCRMGLPVRRKYVVTSGSQFELWP
jgi:hypothetical protein